MEDGLRFYSTIGVQGFLVEPSEPLLESYADRLKSRDGEAANNCDNETQDRKRTAAGSAASSSMSSYLTGELVGTIKNRPQDFVVREILPSRIKIPGLSDEQMDQIRLADLPTTSNSLPVQPSPSFGDNGTNRSNSTHLHTVENGTDQKQTAKVKDGTSRQQQDAVPIVLSSSEIIDLYLHHGLKSSTDDSQPKEIIESLNVLHECAKERVANLRSTDEAEALKDRVVWITPCRRQKSTKSRDPMMKSGDSPDSDGNAKSYSQTREISLYEFCRALESQYPLLKIESLHRSVEDESKTHTSSASTQSNEASSVKNFKPNDNWIRASITTEFDDLIPYLIKPVDDLVDLIRFRCSGLDGYVIRRKKVQDKEKTNETTRASTGNLSIDRRSEKGRKSYNRGMNTVWGNVQLDHVNGLATILHLQPNLSKDDRRALHRIVASLDRNLETSTVSIDENVASSNESSESIDVEHHVTLTSTASTALVVTWQNRAVARATENKRKRSHSSSKKTNLDNKSQDTNPENIFCVLKKSQREHLTTMQNLSRALKCRQSDIGFAGIKDMQAVTYQFITLRNMKRHRVEHTNHIMQNHQGGSIQLGLFYNVNFMLNTGDLDGNRFDIVIRNFARVRVYEEGTKINEGESTVCNPPSNVWEYFDKCNNQDVNRSIERVLRHGFINFYGEQRTGPAGDVQQVGVRPFEIGRAMLKRDFKTAIDLLMKGCTHRESDGARHVRDAWIQSGGNPTTALKAFSGDILPRERAVLKGLNRFPDKPLEALRFVPYAMRTFWIHSYQSLVWNHAASFRIKKYGNNVVIGDLYMENDQSGRDNVKVVTASVDITSISMDQIVLPLPGYNIKLPENDVGKFYQEFLDKDRVCFNQDSEPDCTAKGGYRKLIVRPKNLTSSLTGKDSDKFQSQELILSFELPKGSFATMFLRELMLTTVFRKEKGVEIADDL